ncbi:hypothetical protein BJX63DRAFT_435965 [Aspergillus granulosus]|uniref:Uncharacterized protein n=1 Tax=Aspergillus granulosus TaxID=176169 RepID=A0ABR4GZH2_9EURO
MSGNPTAQVKEALGAAGSTTSDWAQTNVVNPIRSYLATEKWSETGACYVYLVLAWCACTIEERTLNTRTGNTENHISPEESEQIDRMEKDKVVEFLQERNKSDAGPGSRKRG